MTRGWHRVSRKCPCPICGRPDWCGVFADGSKAVCMRVESDRATRNGGFVHILRDQPRQGRQVRRVRPVKQEGPRRDFGRLAAEYAVAVDQGRLQGFATELELSAESLTRLGIGWSAEHRAWSFPMSDADGLVRGIRLRSWSGRKWAVSGGHEGLFVPIGLTYVGRLLICEGPSDTGALLDLGLEAVGRPSCAGGVALLVELVKVQRVREVVIVADADDPGQRGAETLASTLAVYVPVVRVIQPPAGIKDARVWKRSGAAAADVLAAIEKADVRRLTTRMVKCV